MPHSEDLKTVIDKAFRRLEKALYIEASDLGDDFIDPGSDDFDPDEHELAASDKIALHLPRCNVDGIELTYGELDSFASEIEKAELRDNLECWTPSRFLIRVEHIGSYESYLKLEALQGKDGPLQSIKIGDCEYELYFDSGTTPFGFMVLKSGNWEKYFPPVMDEDLFMGVLWTGKHQAKDVRRLVDGFIFELASSLEIFLRRAPRPDYEFDDHLHDSVPPPRELRPVLHEDGLSDVLNLYSLAIATDDPEFQIIGFVKVLEHISATVVREDLASAVRAKLLSSRALDPDAEFILELEAVITAHTRQHRKGSDALRLTVQKCCDPTELARHAPGYLKVCRVSVATKDQERLNALAEFASSVSATRNQIVHAKLNYEKTGEECPTAELRGLANACRVAAEQSVRWYALQHQSVRVVRTP
jgi:hypothetical protein